MAEHVGSPSPDPVTTTALAGEKALKQQPGIIRRKDTVTALLVLLGYVATSISNTDFSEATSWAPTVGAWALGLVGIGIHALTKGPVTPSVVQAIVAESEKLVKRRG